MKQSIKKPVLAGLLRLGRLLRRKSPPPPIPISEIRRVLVFQNGGLGDVLRVFPVIRLLQRRFPKAELVTVTSAGRQIFDLLPDPTGQCVHVHFNFETGYLGKLRQLKELRKRRCDLAVVPARGDGVIECTVMMFLTGARWRIGFDQEGSGFLHTHTHPFSETEPMISQNMGLLRHLGIEQEAPDLQISIPEDSRHSARKRMDEWRQSGAKIVLLHPWAVSHPDFRAWPAERFAGLARRLSSVTVCKIVLLGGPSEKEWAAQLENMAGEASLINLTGQTSLCETVAIIEAGDLFIGNDSSLLHFAVATGTPSLAIFGATSPQQVLPPSHRCEIVSTALPCQPCLRHQPLFSYTCGVDFQCLRDVTVDEVLDRGMAILSNAPVAFSNRTTKD